MPAPADPERALSTNKIERYSDIKRAENEAAKLQVSYWAWLHTLTARVMAFDAECDRLATS